MYKRVVLDNGLVLVTNKIARKKVVLLVGVKVGSVQDGKGINHFIEHMFFRSNPYRTTQQIAEELEDKGAETNAFAGLTDTFFYIKSLSSELSNIIEIIYQATTNLDFNQREFLLEKKNILSEIYLWPEQPMNYAYEGLFLPTIFSGTPLQEPVAGKPESLKLLRRKHLVDFKKKWYVPNNMIIVVCGGFDEKKLEKKILETFGLLEFRSLPEVKLEIKIENERREVFEEKEGIKHAYLHLGYRVPGIIKSETFKLEVLARILAGGLSSRLFREFRDKRGFGYAVDCSLQGLKEIGVFSVGLTLFEPTPKRLRLALEVITNEFEKLKTDLVEERELQRAKDSILSGYYDELERIENKALEMLTAESFDIPYQEFKKFPHYIQSVSAQGIKNVARKYLTSKYTLTALVPKDFKI